MFGGMILALPEIVVPSIASTRSLKNLEENYPQYTRVQFIDDYRKSLILFGVISGTYFIIIAIALLFQFWFIFRLIDSAATLSAGLQRQKPGLKLMMVIVIVSYMLAGIINLFYGHYYNVNDLRWFTRAIIYPITAIILELPNILVMYLIHWDTYKPI